MSGPVRTFKVTTVWTVEVSEEEVMAAEQRVGQEVDPKKIAVFKAIERTVDVLANEATWGDSINIHFDVEEVVN